jgi:hypothetical protein
MSICRFDWNLLICKASRIFQKTHDAKPRPNQTHPGPAPQPGVRAGRRGLIIDFVDLATFGPIGRYLGFPIGAFAGYWMGRALGLERKPCLLCALAAGIYCMMPGTELIPIATVVGALARYRESAPKPDAAPSEPHGQP